jgi:hypothetical protein
VIDVNAVLNGAEIALVVLTSRGLHTPYCSEHYSSGRIPYCVPMVGREKIAVRA